MITNLSFNRNYIIYYIHVYKFHTIYIISILFSNEDFRKRHTLRSNSNVFACQSSTVFVDNKMGREVEEDPRESMHSLYRLPHDADFQCPRCGQRMEEPRLLSCLHPICLSCVYELMSKRKW